MTEVLEDCERHLARADLTSQARQTMASRVRTYLAWLETSDVESDPAEQAFGSSLGGAHNKTTCTRC